MHGRKAIVVVGLLLFALSLLAHISQVTCAERLPIRAYTMADGLAQNTVNRIVRDSRGFLWFCTSDGLSRYDGYRFTNFGIAQGLPDNQIHDLLETRSGDYWVASFKGLSHFNPAGRPAPSNERPSAASQNRPAVHRNDINASPEPMFVLQKSSDTTPVGSVKVLFEESDGTIWCGAGQGLFRLQQSANEWALQVVDIGLPREVENDRIVRALAEDRQGALWIGTGSGIYRRWRDGRTERYTTAQGLPGNDILGLLIDAAGDLWVSTRAGLAQLAIAPASQTFDVVRRYIGQNGAPIANIRVVYQSADSRMWIGLSSALTALPPDKPSAGGGIGDVVLDGVFVQTIAEDRAGNLWVGTDNGAFKLTQSGFTTYTDADGLNASRVSSIFESRVGDLCAVTIDPPAALNRFDGQRFKAIRPLLPGHTDYYGWGWHQLTLQDRAGEWWMPTVYGLARYAKVDKPDALASMPPKAVYTTRDGLASDTIFRLFEDHNSDIWIATFSEARGGLSRWQRDTESFHHYGEAEGLSSPTPVAKAFAEDRAGNLWVGFVNNDSLGRFREGRFTLFTVEDGLPDGEINDLFVDHAGRLWIATTLGGLARLDEPTAERPSFVVYTTAQGLSSNGVNCINEDSYGRLYLGTGGGVDQFDPESGRVKSFTVEDGLRSGEVLVSFRDRKGDLWFGGKSGLSHLTPRPGESPSSPPVLITALRIGGEPQQISALGETALEAAALPPDRNQIQIDFVALGFSSGEGLRYQYKLEGAGDDWSPLAEQRTVNFASLAPGQYRFLVRAVNADGVMSATPASFTFSILPAVWQRWWFLLLVTTAIAAAAYGIYRYRVAQFLKIERVRMRIASDLHDDIGSSLSQISIISEVVRTQLARQESAFNKPLTTIAETSRELVDSMSDIVWAINPQRDSLTDLVTRMRRFAGDTASAPEVTIDFITPDELPSAKLDTDVRRELFLIYKEALNNALRHAHAVQITIELSIGGNDLLLVVEDDGSGFDPAIEGRGHGLFSMRQRAQRLGGQCVIDSAPGEGTRVRLRVPFKGRGRRFGF